MDFSFCGFVLTSADFTDDRNSQIITSEGLKERILAFLDKFLALESDHDG